MQDRRGKVEILDRIAQAVGAEMICYNKAVTGRTGVFCSLINAHRLLKLPLSVTRLAKVGGERLFWRMS